MCDISENNHLIRYCKPWQVDERTKFPTSLIFELRDKLKDGNIEEYLSCNWFEYRESNIDIILEDLKLRMKVSTKGCNALISIYKLKEIAKKYNTEVKIKYLGKNIDSYSGIYPIPRNNFKNYRLQRDLLKSIEKIFEIKNR